ncbi:MAG: hypothetical protein ACT4P3_03165 [Betaproteobacteria bacterium]
MGKRSSTIGETTMLRALVGGLALLAWLPASWGQLPPGTSCNPPVAPSGSGGKWFRDYQQWCRACNGTPSANASPARCEPGPNWGRTSGGVSGTYGSSGAELGRQIGGVLGELLREGLFGNPQQEAQRQAAMEEQRRVQQQENERRAAEQARQDEERYQRLRGSLLGFSPAPQLSLMGTQQGSGGLQLLMGEEAERSSSPALAELTRAAAWSTLAARASTPEDAAMLADAAFQSLIGGKVSLPPPPPDVKGAPVGPWLTEVEALKKQYLDLRPRVPNAMKPVFDAEQRVTTFRRLEAESLALERSSVQAAQKAKAREAAKEARALREKAEAELRAARSEFERHQLAANSLEQSLRAWLSSFAAGERKEDSYYYLGFEDGSQCFSQNAGPRCDKARAPAAQFDNCLASYRRGYSAGETLKKQLLAHAHESGESNGHAGIYEIGDQRANGPCRYDFVMAYNRGYFGSSAGQLAVAPSAAKMEAPAPQPVARRTRTVDERVNEAVNALAKRLEDWQPQERDRLKTAMKSLKIDTDEDYQPLLIARSWDDISARQSLGDLARDAARGEGPGLYGAGTQTGNQDCVIFALATASGRPYSVVAARTAELIRQGEWRTVAQRTNPDAVMKAGLIGQELLLLTEDLGQASVVKSGEFAATLRSGRPIIVSVVPPNFDIQKKLGEQSHQLVLAKTFQRGKETWYEVIDSNQGPLRRLYMSHDELTVLLQENGIAFQPEVKRTAPLLRAPEARQR